MRFLELAGFACLIQLISADASPPEVTLSHGGILVGRRIAFQGVPVDIFQGIRFAKPPTNGLRFKKPERYPKWEGKMFVNSVGNRCPQIEQGAVVGEEDCLFMDITVPGGITPGAEKKAVMVYIHGGAYLAGTGSVHLGAPLAVTGDVIYVSFNYRVSIFGFLADGPGTGNYGLWDQKAALLWVQENIAQFGGDPNLVTIFGESAGAGSVSAHTISPHSGGLFKRAIQQSGTIYQLLPTSTSRWTKLSKYMRQQTNCTAPLTVYDCLQNLTVAQLLLDIQQPIGENFWHPFADSDFFDKNALDYSYAKSQRFDLLIGMNGDEGGIVLATDTAMYAAMTGRTIEHGISSSFTREYLTSACPRWFTPFSAELCADFIINNYGLEEVDDDKERLLLLKRFLGEAFFDADMLNQLSQHDGGEKNTYGYYFTEEKTTVNTIWKVPEWARSVADHGDELSIVFGGAFYSEIEDPLWRDTVSADEFMEGVLVKNAKESDKNLSTTMMIMWTNFAKTGNPNEPTPLPEETVNWPKFSHESPRLMELNSHNLRVIPVPNKERLEAIRSHIYSARKLQFAADRPSAEDELIWLKAEEALKEARKNSVSHDEL
ncbi:bile salt-activated lipase-like [Watersipora subatra]|uniref:bile salt-activated lipase-like n=1 Tax=Watersipora subatra TaxID=2589382 RepID=UPI00355B92A7